MRKVPRLESVTLHYSLARSRAAHQSGALNALDQVNFLTKSQKNRFTCSQVNRFMQVGDWKIFYILGINMEPLVFGRDIILRLENWIDFVKGS